MVDDKPEISLEKQVNDYVLIGDAIGKMLEKNNPAGALFVLDNIKGDYKKDSLYAGIASVMTSYLGNPSGLPIVGMPNKTLDEATKNFYQVAIDYVKSQSGPYAGSNNQQ